MPAPVISVEISGVQSKRGADQVRSHLKSIRDEFKLVDDLIKQVNKNLSNLGARKSRSGNITGDLQQQLQLLQQMSAAQGKAARDMARFLTPLLRAYKALTQDIINTDKALQSLLATSGKLASFQAQAAKAANSVATATARTGTSAQRAATGVKSVASSAKAAANGTDDLREKMAELSKISQIALGPLSGVASRITALAGLTSLTSVGVAGVIAALVGAGGLAVAAIKSASAIEDLVDRANNLGVSIEQLQQFRGVALLAGLKPDLADRALESFARRISQAAEGAGQADRALEELGINIKELGKLPVADAFLAVLDVLPQISDQNKRLAVTADLFSRAGLRLTSVVQGGKQAFLDQVDSLKELNLILDAVTVKQAEAVADKMELLKIAFRNTLVIGLRNTWPVIEETASLLIKLSNAASKFLDSALVPVDQSLSIGRIEDEIKKREELLQANREVANSFPSMFGPGQLLGLSLSTDPFAEEEKAIEALRERVKQLKDEFDGFKDVTIDGNIFKKITAAFDEASKDADTALKDLKEAKEKLLNFQSGGETAVNAAEAKRKALDIIGAATPDDLKALSAQYQKTFEDLGVANLDFVDSLTAVITMQKNYEDSLTDARKASEDHIKAIEDAAVAYNKLRDSIAGEISDLQFEISIFGKSEVEQKALTAQRKLELDIMKERGKLTPQQIAQLKQETAAVSALTNTLESLKAEQKAGIENAKELESLTEKQDQEFITQTEKAAEEAAKAFQKPFENAITNVQDAFTDMFEGILDGGIDSFKDLGKSLINVMKKAIAELATLSLFGALGLGGKGNVGQGLTLNLSGLSGLFGGFGQTKTALSPAEQSQFALKFADPDSAEFNKAFEDKFRTGGASLSTNARSATSNFFGSGGVAQGLAKIGTGVLTGISVGLALGGGKLGGKIGTGVGVAAGGILGGIFGGAAGAGAGSAVGGSLGGFIGGSFDKVLAGDKTARIAVATLAGFFSPTLAGSFFKESKPKKGTLQLQTLAGSRQGFEDNAGFRSPFGFVGLSDAGSKRVKDKVSETIARNISLIDKQFAQLLEAPDILKVASTLQDTTGQKVTFRGTKQLKSHIGLIIQDRIKTIFKALDVGPEQFATIFEGIGKTDIDSILKRTQEFLAVRKGIKDFVDEVTGINDSVIESQKLFKQLEDEFTNVTIAAEEFGIQLTDVGNSLTKAKDRVRAAFNKDIEDQILAFVDPLGLALQQQTELAQQRLKEAIFLGQETNRVELLNALERQKILEDFAQSATGAVRDLLISLTQSGSSPLAPLTILSNARQRFDQVRSQALGSDPVLAASARDLITEASSNLLDASKTAFASSETFFNDFRLVTDTLSAILTNANVELPAGVNVPGLANPVIPGGTGSTVDLLRLIGEQAVIGNSTESTLLTKIYDELVKLNETVVQQQSDIERLKAGAPV